MALTNVQTILDFIIQALYEDKGIFNMCNRSLDGFIKEHGAGEVRIPSLPVLEAVTPPATNRKAVAGDTGMVSVVMQKSVVEIREEVESAYLNKKGRILQGFIDGAAKAHRKNFDAKVILEAQNNGTVIPWNGATVTAEDLDNIDAKFDELEVDPDDRFVVYPARIKTAVNLIDVIKQARGFNQNFLEKGVLEYNNLKLVASARVAKIGGKENLVGIWGPGMAFLLDKQMDKFSVYNSDPNIKATDHDYFAWYGIKLLKAGYAIISKQP
ncbi:MAG TPA: hypothetical protein PK605_00400 [Ignavibacteria bacterium]|nr:hypothetical protein [Bacteroidota bacterium]HRE10760.1 hypothetical protein [Ignavibacteria bacterium]HRF65998.1 hypothetical protein [Ignavibacteria bacterium]HRJ02839.1 hypothetical protein [Ignavibacteria bacterium]HRJ84397.1 hypothetical protein [Ignavibacteria bacterium]